MKTPKDDSLYLIHIGECLDRIAEYTQVGRRAFLTETLIQDAVIRNLQTMGESIRRLSETFKATHPEVDWRGAASVRNVLIHDYLKVDVEEIWIIVTDDLPLFTQQFAPLRPAEFRSDE